MDFQVCQDVKFVEWKTARYDGDVMRYEGEEVREVCGDEADTRDDARASFERIIQGLAGRCANDSQCISATPVGEPVSYKVFSAWDRLVEFFAEGSQRMAENPPMYFD